MTADISFSVAATSLHKNTEARSHYSNVAPQLFDHKWVLFWSLLLRLLLMKGSEFFSSLPLHVAVDLYLPLAFRTLFPFPFL